MKIKRVLVLVLVLFFLSGPLRASADSVLVDDFEQEAANKVGGRTNSYVMAPSRVLALRVTENAHGGKKALVLKYDKKGTGGPYDSGGWCGYYTMLKVGSRYYDASGAKAISFWVRGDREDENFVIGLSDKHWDELGDSVKSEPVVQYLPAGKITKEWQKATVPLSAFMLEAKELASIAICFEGSIYPGGESRGTVYIDDLMLE